MQPLGNMRPLTTLVIVLASSGCVDGDTERLSSTPQPGLRILAEAPPQGRPGAAYAASATAMHGSPPYRWSIAEGALPAGLELDPEGTPTTHITGAPESSGAFDYTLQVEDADGRRAQSDFRIVVRDSLLALSLLTTALPEGVLNVPYSTQVVAMHGVPPYYWSRLGELPPGITIEGGTPAAIVSGTPTRGGRFDVSLEVVDAIGDRVERSFSIVVSDEQPLRITTGGEQTIDFATTSLGRALSLEVVAEGGAGPYRWRVDSGQLPAGLHLDPEGTPRTAVLGAPTELGTFTGVITVADAHNNTDSKPYSLTVGPPIDITTTELVDATACAPYRATLTARGGSGSDYRWAIVGGRLPPGLHLRAVGTPSTVITGTPDRASLGPHILTIEVNDQAGGTDTQSLVLNITDGGERLTVAIAGDLEVDERTDLYLADLCGAAPVPGVRVSTNTEGAETSVHTSVSVPAFSPDGRKVAFVVGRGAPGVHVSQLDGGVVGPPVRVSSPEWNESVDIRTLRFSGDSRRLAFVASGHASSTANLYVVDVSGAPVADSAVVVNPQSHADAEVAWRASAFTFSADSSRLAFVYDGTIDGQQDLWIADVLTVRPRSAFRVTQSVPGGDVSTDNIVAVPGGASFIIHGDIATDRTDELFLVDAALSPPTMVQVSAPLALGQNVLSGAADFGCTEDGSLLWYGTREAGGAGAAIWRVDLSSPGAAVRLSASSAVGSNMRQGVLAGAGRSLLVLADLASKDQDELFLFDLDGPARQGLAAARVNAPLPPGHDGVREPIAVSADGGWVAYAAGQTRMIYLAAILGTTALPPAAVAPSVQRFRTHLVQIAFAPDSSAVAFAAYYDNSNASDAYLVSLQGSAPGPWRKLTSVSSAPTYIQGVKELFFASPTKLVLRGDLLVRNDRDSYLVDLSDPNAVATRITTQYLPGHSDVEQVIMP